MIRLYPNTKTDILKKDIKPAAYCKDGDTVIFETNDCFDNSITYSGIQLTDKKYMQNPATGPLYIEGAEKGDALCVEIKSVKTNTYGIVKTHFGESAFEDIKRQNGQKIIDIKDGSIDFEGKKIPLNIMIGVIGVAPDDPEGVVTVSAGEHGGNLDCTRVREGAKIYFPVAVNGALFALGDLHAVMGDGEVSGYGLEVSGEVVAGFSVIKGKCVKAPVIYYDNTVMILASAKTLDEAVKKANTELFNLLVANGWSEPDAAMLMSLNANIAVCQVVNPVKTVRMSLRADLIRK